jgi:hypothetical protein
LILLEVQKILRSDCACSIFQSSMNPQYVWIPLFLFCVGPEVSP